MTGIRCWTFMSFLPHCCSSNSMRLTRHKATQHKRSYQFHYFYLSELPSPRFSCSMQYAQKLGMPFSPSSKQCERIPARQTDPALLAASQPELGQGKEHQSLPGLVAVRRFHTQWHSVIVSYTAADKQEQSLPKSVRTLLDELYSNRLGFTHFWQISGENGNKNHSAEYVFPCFNSSLWENNMIGLVWV